MMTIGSLFAGYGGLDLAAEAAFGARTAWVSEIDPGACKVLAHRFPDAPNLGDITTIDWATAPPVDIITGGSPCQDLSTAGRRAGMTDGTRSNLWVQMREAIAHVQPRFVVWENVRGALSAHAASDLEPCAGCVGDGRDKPHLRALGRVLGDLAELGFDAEWRGLRASDVGACHQRFRLFVLAWRRDAADAYGSGLQGQRDPQGAAPARRYGHAEQGAGGPDLAIAPDLHDGPRCGEPSRADVFAGVWCSCERPQFGQYAAAVARQESAFGHPAPPPTEPGKNRPRLSARFTEWMMGLPAGWITDVPCVTRNEALRACGNGVVPQQAHAALLDMLTTITQERAA